MEEAPELADAFERFGDEIRWQRPAIQFALETRPGIRYQFSSTKRERMVQLQSTRLMLNCVRHDAAYPQAFWPDYNY